MPAKDWLRAMHSDIVHRESGESSGTSTFAAGTPLARFASEATSTTVSILKWLARFPFYNFVQRVRWADGF